MFYTLRQNCESSLFRPVNFSYFQDNKISVNIYNQLAHPNKSAPLRNQSSVNGVANEDNDGELPLLTNIKIVDELSGGNFGTVSKGIWCDTTEVALKTLIKSEKDAFMEESKLLMKLNHPNVLRYLGSCSIAERDYIVTEFYADGNVRDLLQTHKNSITAIDILCMARDVAAGMNYLSLQNIVHRDLGARNLLAKAEKQSYSIKISDFGMSRVLYEGNEYVSSSRVFATRWAAPEVIQHRKFSVASDIFSFGTTFWEMLQYGTVPFYECTSESEVATRILQGQLLQQPENCPDALFTLMQKCWSTDLSERPSFLNIFGNLDQYIKSQSEAHINSANFYTIGE